MTVAIMQADLNATGRSGGGGTRHHNHCHLPAVPLGRSGGPGDDRAPAQPDVERYQRVRRPPIVIRARWPVDRRGRSQRWHDAVAERLALQAIVDLDLDTLASTEPPRGFGRD